MTDLQQLAADVLSMFDMQREYFKTRKPEQLNQCKDTEARLKRRCKEILNNKQDAPSLFPTE